jgi:beta-1,2-mannobiose phosphorylase / 1,2-beta-oligomannan phosphorylase
VSHLIFPSGALIKKVKNKEVLEVYYGAADTHCCKAEISLDNLLKTIMDGGENYVKRYPGNPIIIPRPKAEWESKGTFNPAAIDIKKQVHILYRAVSSQDVSTIGLAVSKDGLSVDERANEPIYQARTDFESKGCEDPRVMQIGDRIYMTYTAYDGRIPRVAISSISEKDFLKRDWQVWSQPIALTPENVDNKDACIIPQETGGKYVLLHRVHEHICGFVLPSLDFPNIKVNECIDFIGPRRGMWDGDKVGIAAPPIKTKEGWLLLYHGVSHNRKYRVGAALLDLDDPLTILARSAVPLFEPEEEYEINGPIPNVVFPCGLVARGDKAYMYYGGADFVVGVATFSIKEVLKRLLD